MKNIFLLVLTFCLLTLSACSSLESDAEKAAELNKQSLEAVMNNDMEKAEKLFKESDEIINKYKATADFEEFYAIYLKHVTTTPIPAKK